MKNIVVTLWLAFLMLVAVAIIGALVGLGLTLLPTHIQDDITGSPFLAIGVGAAILLAGRAFWKRAVAAHRAQAEKLKET